MDVEDPEFWARAAAVRDRVLAAEAEREAAKERLNADARHIAALLTASGEVVQERMVPANGPWPPCLVITTNAGGQLDLYVGAPGWLPGLVREEIHDCRDRLATDLLGRLRTTQRPDGSWPEAEAGRIVRAWMEDQGVNPAAPPE